MSALLRTGKFLRYFTNVARNLVFPAARTENEGLISQNRQVSDSTSQRELQREDLTGGELSQSVDHAIYQLSHEINRRGYTSLRNVEDVFSEVTTLREHSPNHILTVILCCGNLMPDEPPDKRTMFLQEIWKTMENMGVALDISHYNALLNVYVENEHAFSPEEFLSFLESRGLQPNSATYLHLIARHCQNGNIDGATSMLKFMQEANYPLNRNIFHSLILGHARANDYESCKIVLTLMKQADVVPIAETYKVLMCAYAEKGDLVEIESIISQCEEQGMVLTTTHYLDILYTLAIKGHSEKAEQFFSKVSEGRQSLQHRQVYFRQMIRLIHAGFDDIAYRLQLLMPTLIAPNRSGEPSNQGGRFLANLIKSGKPLEKVLDYCTRMKDDNLNHRSLESALHGALSLQKEEMALGIINAMKVEGHVLRPHYFWPLLVMYKKDANTEGVLSILRAMIAVEVLPSWETMKEHIIPVLHSDQQNTHQLIRNLREMGIDLKLIVTSLLDHLFMAGNISEAVKIAYSYRTEIFYNRIKKSLTSALVLTEDVSSYCAILRCLGKENKFRTEFITGEFLQFFIMYQNTSKNFNSLLSALLQELISQKQLITETCVAKIQEQFGDHLASNLNKQLTRLSISKHDIGTTFRNYEELSNSQTKMNPKKLLQLLSYYFQQKDVTNALQVKQDLSNLDIDLSVRDLLLLCRLTAETDHLDESLKLIEEVKRIHPSFSLHLQLVMNIVQMMLQRELYEDAKSFLEKHADHTTRNMNLSLRHYEILAERGEVELLKEFLQMMKNFFIDDLQNFERQSAVLMYKAYTNQGNAEDAVATMVKFVEDFKVEGNIPYTFELLKMLIEKNEHDKIKVVLKESAKACGEMTSIYKLIFAFLRGGRLQQAENLINTPGLRAHYSMKVFCRKCIKDGHVEDIENLISISKNVFDIDKAELYYFLLQGYIKRDNPKMALTVWERVTAENIKPSPQFYEELGSYLQKCGYDVPFTMPLTQSVEVDRKHEPHPQSRRNQYEELEKDHITLSPKIEQLVRSGKSHEALLLVKRMLRDNLYPQPKIFKFFCTHLVNGGQYVELEEIKKLLEVKFPQMVVQLSLDNLICAAYVMAQQSDKFLTQLEDNIRSANPENIPRLSVQFPIGGVQGILDRSPNLKTRYESLCAEYAKHGIMAPYNALWQYYVCDNNYEMADNIFYTHLKGQDKLMCRKITSIARNSQDERLARYLVERMNETSCTKVAKSYAYSCLLDVLCFEGKFQDALSCLEEVIKNADFDCVHRVTLQRIKKGVEDTGGVFPYTIRTASVVEQRQFNSRFESDYSM